MRLDRSGLTYLLRPEDLPDVSEFCCRTRQEGKPEALPDQPNNP